MTDPDSTKLFACEYCGENFPDNKGKNRFCSYACARSVSTAIEITCLYCGNTFMVNKARESQAKYCSRECGYADKHVLFTCEQCGETTHRRRHWVKGARTRRFCSYECATAWHKLDNHSNWKGGWVKWRGPNWKLQKNKARKRDKHTCQECGVTEAELGRPMDVHHLTPWREFDFKDYRDANALPNLISLCPRCHTTIERRPNHTRTNLGVPIQLRLDLHPH